VIGVPDDKWGEAVKAIVVMKPGKKATAVGHHRIHPRTHRRLQDAEVGGFHRSAAAQRLRQDLAAPFARSLLGGQGPAGELSFSTSPRLRGEVEPKPTGRREAPPDDKLREGFG